MVTSCELVRHKLTTCEGLQRLLDFPESTVRLLGSPNASKSSCWPSCETWRSRWAGSHEQHRAASRREVLIECFTAGIQNGMFYFLFSLHWNGEAVEGEMSFKKCYELQYPDILSK